MFRRFRAKSGVLKSEYKHESISLCTDVDCNLGGPLVNAAATIGHQVRLSSFFALITWTVQ